MSVRDALAPRILPQPHRARPAARVLAVVAAALVAYACWRGYQSPDFLLGVAAAFGLC